MSIDLNPFFQKYAALVEVADKTFRRVAADFCDCVMCKVECCDCCHAMFDIPLIEALHIHHRFRTELDEDIRQALIEDAGRTDRKIYRIKRAAQKAAEEGRNKDALIRRMGTERVRCPLLNGESRCELYEYRPVTCRLYGIPAAINGIGQTCGLSGFKKGSRYPTVQLEIFHRRLYELSLEVVHAVGSSREGLADLLVPVSAALITDFEEELFGSKEEQEKDERSEA